ISTATTGVQGLLGTGSAVFGANLAKNQIVSTAEEVTAAVRRELTSGFDPDSIRTTLQRSLDQVQLPQLNVDQLGGQFERLLKEVDFSAIGNSDLLKNVNRDTLAKLVSSRTDLSKKDVNRITDQLEAAWKKAVSSKDAIDPQELIQQLKSAAPQDLKSGKFSDQLNQLIKSASKQGDSDGNMMTTRALQFGTTAVLSRVLQNVDLSDLDVEKIGSQLRTFGNSIRAKSDEISNGKSTAKPFSIVQADLEDYLLLSPSWKLNQENAKDEFRHVIYDVAADPSLIQQELMAIDREYFVQVLSFRDDITPPRIQNLARQLDAIRVDVLTTAQTAAT
ncbi:MAG: MFS transporter, partial [Leptolyngbyaceae cyanobacterium CAN_BIN12]|nr:MFS transporter [Leptolyngbyaceae cyanobacterium CAN_BIN12]